MKNNLIEFTVAVTESSSIARSICGHQLRLGEIGANVKTIYGDKTLARLAEASNIPYASFKCYVAVWRAYEGKKLDGLTFGVLQALVTVPNRAALLSADPGMTVKAARKIAAAYKKSIKPVLTDEQKLTAAWVRADKAEAAIIKTAAGICNVAEGMAIDNLTKSKFELKTAFAEHVFNHPVKLRPMDEVDAEFRERLKTFRDPDWAGFELPGHIDFKPKSTPVALPVSDWTDAQIIDHCEDEWAKPADEKIDYAPILAEVLQSIETPPESVAPYAKKPQHKEHDKAYWERHPEPAPDEGQQLAA